MMVDYLQQHSAWDIASEEWRNPSERKRNERENGFFLASFFDRLDKFPDMPGPAVNQLDHRFLFADAALEKAFSKQGIQVSSVSTENDWEIDNQGELPGGK